eukprot:1541179-Prymnesium_polylepis.1
MKSEVTQEQHNEFCAPPPPPPKAAACARLCPSRERTGRRRRQAGTAASVTRAHASRGRHVLLVVCSARSHHVLIACSSRAHHCSARAQHVLSTCSARAHHVFITCSSRAYHVPITYLSRAHQTPPYGTRARTWRPADRYVSQSFDDPRFTLHFTTDAPISIKAIFYVPQSHLEKWGMARQVRPQRFNPQRSTRKPSTRKPSTRTLQPFTSPPAHPAPALNPQPTTRTLTRAQRSTQGSGGMARQDAGVNLYCRKVLIQQ